MDKYECTVCTKWDDVPADWVCPLCGAAKDAFQKM